MQFTTSAAIAIVAALAGTSLAAPAPAPAVKSMMASGSTWTMQSFLRVCNDADTTCNYSFSVNENDGTPATPCAYTVDNKGATPASQVGYQNVVCGAFTIGSSWSDQFGAGNGFQVLSVVSNGLIIFPGYTDAQLNTNSVVTPDQSYTPQAVPS